MLYLVFDLGNSRAKLARLAGDGLDFVTVLPVERFTTDPAGALEPFGEVEGALGVSSHPQAYKILRGYLERRGIEPVSARERCPLVVEYGESLGDDRVLAAHAAVDSLGAPCAVVGCGTAVTVDLVDESVRWFADMGSPPVHLGLIVGPAADGPGSEPGPTAAAR